MSKTRLSVQELPGMDKVPITGEQQPLRYTRQPGTFAWNVVDMMARFSGKSMPQILDHIIKDWAEQNLMTIEAIQDSLIEGEGGEK